MGIVELGQGGHRLERRCARADPVAHLAEELRQAGGRDEDQSPRRGDQGREVVTGATGHEHNLPRADLQLVRAAGERVSALEDVEHLVALAVDVRRRPAARQADLLEQLEGAARDFQPLDVRTMLEEGAARLKMLGPRTIALDAPGATWVSGDPDLLDQALLNVLKNAFSHTAEGGRITLAATADDAWVRITVTDDGPGIPEAELSRIFDRFYRAQGPRPQDSGGAGLGLAIAWRLVDLHGGTNRAENIAGTGARFTIELPRIGEPRGYDREE